MDESSLLYWKITTQQVTKALTLNFRSACKRFSKSGFGQCLFFSCEIHNVIIIDMIMDMLGQPKLRQIITESYQTSDEPKRVRDTITEVTQRYIV